MMQLCKGSNVVWTRSRINLSHAARNSAERPVAGLAFLQVTRFGRYVGA